MKQRISAAKEYVSSTENPTMTGAYQAMMPSVSTIGKMYEKYGGSDPGSRVGVCKQNGIIGPNRLNLWFEANKEKMSPEDRLVSEGALADLKSSACSYGNLCTSVDIGD